MFTHLRTEVTGKSCAVQVFPAVRLAALQDRLVDMESIHARIRRLRKKHGMSLPTFAQTVGVKWQSAQQWEKEIGGTAPSRKRQPKVAEILGVSVQELMHGAPEAKDAKEAANELESLLGWLTKEQRDDLMADLRSKAAANKAIAKELGGQVRPVPDTKVRAALGRRKPAKAR